MVYRMIDIIPLLGLPFPPRGRCSYNVACPCCDRKHDKHLNINFVKNVFRCPKCGFCGGVLALYGHYTGLADNNIIREELSKRLGGDVARSFTKTSRKVIESSNYTVVECPLTDIDVRDATYRALLSRLTLSTDHRMNLLSRGLTADIIDQKMYKTTPVAGTKAIAKQLLSDGHYLAGIPGFYRNNEDKQWTFIQNQRGILIPVRDLQGRIQGLQVRCDNVKRRKFRWVSSSERLDGCHAEGWVHVAGAIRDQVLLIEGHMKADIVHHLTGQTVISIPGVNALSHLESVLVQLKKLGVKKIMTAFDMDFLSNPNVRNAYNNLVWMIQKIGILFGTYLWNPEFNGLDDYVWRYLISQ